eukprot:855281-Pyramimonas_sp.AAC.1
MEANKKAMFKAAFDYPRWDSIPMYENCRKFYAGAKALVIKRGSGAEVAYWDVFKESTARDRNEPLFRNILGL